jgi:polyhydroxyalkanoate synthesis regulator phasin
MGMTVVRKMREPENPRQNMELSDMSPDDARQFIHDLMTGIYSRMQKLDSENFNDREIQVTTQKAERAKQWYGNDTYQLLSGIQAALREWDESGRDVQELKEQYGGKFVKGVEIGERLAVYQGSDFTFTEGEEDTSDESTFDITY